MANTFKVKINLSYLFNCCQHFVVIDARTVYGQTCGSLTSLAFLLFFFYFFSMCVGGREDEFLFFFSFFISCKPLSIEGNSPIFQKIWDRVAFLTEEDETNFTSVKLEEAFIWTILSRITKQSIILKMNLPGKKEDMSKT